MFEDLKKNINTLVDIELKNRVKGLLSDKDIAIEPDLTGVALANINMNGIELPACVVKTVFPKPHFSYRKVTVEYQCDENNDHDEVYVWLSANFKQGTICRMDDEAGAFFDNFKIHKRGKNGRQIVGLGENRGDFDKHLDNYIADLILLGADGKV